MDVSIQKITSQSAYLNQVIELGDKNKGTLGFLPQNAFINQAKNGNIIIAVTILILCSINVIPSPKFIPLVGTAVICKTRK